MSSHLTTAFYQHPNLNISSPPSRSTRLRCINGTTGTCYLAQKLDLITGAILNLPEEYKITYFETNDEEKILNSYLFNFLYTTLLEFFATFINHYYPFINQSIKTEDYIRDFLEKQGDLDDEKIREFISSIKNMYKILTGQFDGSYYKRGVPLKSNDINKIDIEELFKESMDIPIALAFGKKGHIVYDIDHWFTLFKGKIHGTFGNDPEFVINYYSVETTSEEFFEFLCAMKEDTQENREFIKNYIKKIWLDPTHFRKKKDYDETRRRTEKEYSIDKIDKYINDTPRLIYQQDYNIFEMKGSNMYDNNSSNSLKKIIEVFLKTGLFKQFKGYLDVHQPRSRPRSTSRSRSRSISQTRSEDRIAGGKKTSTKKRRPTKRRSTKKRRPTKNRRATKRRR